MTRSFYLILIVICFITCNDNKSTSALNLELTPLALVEQSSSGIDFVNKVDDQKDFNILTYRNYYNGGGVAIGDINNDGLNDVYFTANMTSNKLYLNKGKMNFEDITAKAGVAGKNSWCTGVTMADVNADGWLDIYVCYSGDVAKENKENELFINNKNNTFTERAKEYGLNDAGLSTHAAFFDFDLDGDLDCYVLNNSYIDPDKITYIPRDVFEENALGGDRLYRNDGVKDGVTKFVNITKAAGLYSNNVGYGLGISVGDVNADQYPDIYISNDFWERDYLYINQKNGTFKEQLAQNVSYTSLASMGSDIADINNDGTLDIFSTDMLPTDNLRLKAAMKFEDYHLFTMKARQNYHYSCTQNCLQLNQGDGSFTECAFQSGVSATDWSWGALIFDLNLDGRKDIFVSNGVLNDITDSDFIDFLGDQTQVKNIVLKNGRYDFRDFVKYLPPNKRKNYMFLSTQDGYVPNYTNAAKALNMDQPSFSNGSAYSDLDNDGDHDLVVNNVNMAAFIYENKTADTKKGSFVKYKFSGQKENAFGIGTSVYIYNQGKMQMAHNLTARGFQSSVAPEMIFGIGSANKIDSMRVIWPDGKSQLILNMEANKTHTLSYSQADQNFKYTHKLNPIFEQSALDGAVHIENSYNDFDVERLMPHALSTEGPKIIKGDVNKDGKEDFILQGAKDMADKLFINQGNTFKEIVQPAFVANKNKESISGALFDADRDGDLDYLVGIGGNEFREGINYFKSLYYENDGKGSFVHQLRSGPQMIGQIGCIKPCDIDGDGDLDLFAGGKAIPGSYGVVPRSYILINDGNGVWTDRTSEYTGPIGMVTDACWSDVNKDNRPDLIVVGEWMPVTIFINHKAKLLTTPIVVPGTEGWWNTIEASDLDKDGDMDYLLGNWGTNIKFHASPDRPLTMYVSDFDQNKKTEPIIEWYTQDDDKPYPFGSRADIFGQLPSLKKQGLKYHDFAEKQVEDFFKKEVLAKASQKKVVNFQSSILRNNNGDFVIEALPDQAQLSPIFAFEVADFDNDGLQDFYAGGNYYRLKPEVGRHDGFHGGYFKGLGNGKFNYILPKASGLICNGEVRDAITIDKQLLIARNNDSVLIYNAK